MLARIDGQRCGLTTAVMGTCSGTIQSGRSHHRSTLLRHAFQPGLPLRSNLVHFEMEFGQSSFAPAASTKLCICIHCVQRRGLACIGCHAVLR